MDTGAGAGRPDGRKEGLWKIVDLESRREAEPADKRPGLGAVWPVRPVRRGVLTRLSLPPFASRNPGYPSDHKKQRSSSLRSRCCERAKLYPRIFHVVLGQGVGQTVCEFIGRNCFIVIVLVNVPFH